MAQLITKDEDYRQWLIDLKKRIRQSQIKAAMKVNSELINLYWFMGRDMVEKQEKTKWGEKFMTQLSKDLQEEFPEMKGFSKRNLELIRQWYLFYYEDCEIAQQLVSQIPWGHNLKIISKCKSITEAIFYIRKTIELGWSRETLDSHLNHNEYGRIGCSTTNFTFTLPPMQSDLAQQVLKDPYNFDFLSLSENYRERDLEDALTENVTRFLLELGSGFAYVGRQVSLQVGDREFFVDLLFYHLKLRCYVVIELKAVEFIPEFAGKLSFYLSAVNDILAHPSDNPTIGLIVCKSKDTIVADYALKSINQPMGISEYELTKHFPMNYKGSLPTIEEIEAGLKK